MISRAVGSDTIIFGKRFPPSPFPEDRAFQQKTSDVIETRSQSTRQIFPTPTSARFKFPLLHRKEDIRGALLDTIESTVPGKI